MRFYSLEKNKGSRQLPNNPTDGITFPTQSLRLRQQV
jgi:hypothetical protein